ncbi:MAG TPA: YhjD/YihY/BrkB family envelope integrity protein [Candidatus Binatia bacterium]|nr:YhjD/YihY/BrkB family envelope integrity protein [Candidatus Binatia bacterium]
MKVRSFLRVFNPLRIRSSQFFHLLFLKYYENMLGLRAASLTYATLLSLVPLLAVTFSVLKAFGVQQLIEPFLTQALAPLGPDRVEITRRLIGFVDNTRVDVLGAVGVAGLFYSVIYLVSTVEEALNQIWRTQPSRTWTRRYGEYMGLLLVGPVLIFAAFAVIASAQSYWIVQRLVDTTVFGLRFALLTRFLPFLFLWAAFAFLYKVMPSTHVPLSSSIIGAAVAAILWQLLSIVFTAFIVNSVSYAAIYSGFAILVVFLVWLYAAWLVILIGAQVSYLHQHSSVYLPGAAAGKQGHLFEEQLALSLLCEIGQRFITGKPPATEKNLSRTLGVPPDQLDSLLEKYIGRGLVLRSAEPAGVSLARPPEQITATEILDVLHGPADSSGGNSDPVSEFLRRRDAIVHESLAAVTLKDLASPDRSV